MSVLFILIISQLYFLKQSSLGMNKQVMDFSMSMAHSTHKTIKNKRITFRKKSRLQKIRDKNVIYPKSTQDKIVFVTNSTGNGFRRQKLHKFHIPSHIPIENMFQEINSTCYQQWIKFHYQNEENNFFGLKIALLIILSLVFILVILYFIMVDKELQNGITACNYLLYLMIGAMIIVALITGNQERQEVNYEQEMIKVIKQKLHEINCRQVVYYGQKVKYRWSCHTDCLWIALNI